MTRSMTGFGKASRDLDGDQVTVEVNAVNHRFLDSCMHLPGAWGALEPVLKEALRQQVARGRVNVWVIRKRGTGARRAVQFDAEVARQYIAAARELAHLMGSMDSISLDTLAQMEGIFSPEDAEEDLERVQSVIVETLGEALTALNRMRDTEGEALAVDLRHRIALLGEALADIEARLPELEALHRARLQARVDELKADATVAEDRLAVELAMLAEKGDVTEEVVRFRAHMDHALELIASEEPAGRELNFLVQEFQREVNTLGSKVRDSDVTRDVVRMKSELEKFREQIQNIE